MAEDMRNARERDGSDSYKLRGAPRRQGKPRRWLINLFDVVVIALILTAVILFASGVNLFGVFSGDKEKTECKVTYEILLEDVDAKYADAISAGESVSDARNYAVGVVTGDVTTVPYTVPHCVRDAENEDAPYCEMREIPGRMNITVKISADATYEEGVGYVVGGCAIRVGESVTLRFPGYYGNAVCTAVEVTKSEGK